MMNILCKMLTFWPEGETGRKPPECPNWEESALNFMATCPLDLS